VALQCGCAVAVLPICAADAMPPGLVCLSAADLESVAHGLTKQKYHLTREKSVRGLPCCPG